MPRISPARWRIARCWSREKSSSREDGDAIAKGLEQIRGEIEGGTFPFRAEHEDIHLNIEARLTS